MKNPYYSGNHFLSEFLSNAFAFNIYLLLDEELIKWGWPEDVWFHVDKLSSAHVYLRLKPGETLDDVPMTVITDCAQLVKYNSISGNKMNDIDVVYTMWSNLKKTEGMEVGQVSEKLEENMFNVEILTFSVKSKFFS